VSRCTVSSIRPAGRNADGRGGGADGRRRSRFGGVDEFYRHEVLAVAAACGDSREIIRP
jgi:hypothetical protein